MTVVRLSYTLRFLCPAFLGNAEQSGQWRTPPVKALLRQWWRVAYAADNRFVVDVAKMRAAEGRLFGAAADADASNKSRIRIRLDKWDIGRLKRWEPIQQKVRHPEVGHNGMHIGSDLYLGYGPLTFKGGTTAFKDKANAAIQAGESAVLNIALLIPTLDNSQEGISRIAKAIALMNLYGTLGGRSRNGWGSFVLEPLDRGAALPSLDASVLRSWKDALKLDWPHAIGRDQKGALVWQTEPFSDWKAAMRRLAEVKIGLRTKFKFAPGNAEPQERHWLSYPVTRHLVWGGIRRLPNSLRFKLRPDSRDRGKLRGVIFHVPCLPPREFTPNRYLRVIEQVWQQVHQFLDDSQQKLSRIPT
jgi:CRISPR-associated protein Cmr1